MAEVVDGSPARALARAGERPGRTRNRRRQYEQRRAAARNTKDLLKAAADYFWGTFAAMSPDEVEIICDRLVAHVDSERRRIDGSP